MAEFIITGPDGRKVKVTGPNREGALAKAKEFFVSAATPPAPTTSPDAPQPPDAGLGSVMLDKFNQGIVNGIGGTVDLVDMAGQKALGFLSDRPYDDRPPMLGSEHLNDLFRREGLFGPAITDVQPNTLPERALGRISQEAGAIAGPGGFLTNTAKGAKLLIAAILGGGSAAAAANEALPGNETADLIASLLGGSFPVVRSLLTRPNSAATSAEELAKGKTAAFANAEANAGAIAPQSLEELVGQLRGTTSNAGMHPVQHPNANAALSSIEEGFGPLPQGTPYARSPKTIMDVEQERRLLRDNVGRSALPGEGRLGAKMTADVEDYLSSLTPDQITGGNPRLALEELRRGTELAQREFKANDVKTALSAAQLDAASSGAGGNEINRVRQKIKWIINPEYPERLAGYSAQERAMMDKIVRGSFVENRLRNVGALSPFKGGLQLGAYGATALNSGVDGKLLALGGLGIAAQTTAEVMTKANVNALIDVLRSGKPLPPREFNAAENRVLAALLAASAAQGVSGQ